MELTEIKDLDNIIWEFVRYTQIIDIDNINKQIKSIEIDEREIFYFRERIIYFDKICISPCCCIKCGNFMNKFDINDTKGNMMCKCNKD